VTKQHVTYLSLSQFLCVNFFKTKMQRFTLNLLMCWNL